MEFADMSNEQVAQWAELMDADQIKLHASELNPNQIQALIVSINEENDQDWRTKTRASVEGLTKSTQLEAIGRALSPSQALDLIAHNIQWEDSHRNKLASLLVGMPNHVFIRMLKDAKSEHLETLKFESMTEAIQHHLTILSHELDAHIQTLDGVLTDIENEIDTLEIKALGYTDRAVLEKRIEELGYQYRQNLTVIDKALSLAWNTNRLDIIEKISRLKEIYQRALSSFVGERHYNGNPSTGLYLKLENKLFSVYGNPNDPKDINALQNDDPAIEGLSKLSVWYLKDYLAMGLLPNADYAEVEDVEQRSKLMLEAKHNLERLGLITVGDLKRRGIFSKKSLIEWLVNHL